MCWPNKADASLYAAFWNIRKKEPHLDGQIRKRHPFGGTQLDKQKGNCILAPIYLLSWMLMYRAQTAQLYMVVERNEDPITKGI